MPGDAVTALLANGRVRCAGPRPVRQWQKVAPGSMILPCTKSVLQIATSLWGGLCAAGPPW